MKMKLTTDMVLKRLSTSYSLNNGIVHLSTNDSNYPFIIITLDTLGVCWVDEENDDGTYTFNFKLDSLEYVSKDFYEHLLGNVKN